MNGVLITFEGGEGAGKTTLIDKLFAHLQERRVPVIKTRAPGGTKTGDLIRSILLNRTDLSITKRCELFLFLADRAQHVEEVIIPAMKQGKIVLCDRFNDSTAAYQGGARGFDEHFVRSLCHFATANLEPNLTLYLDIDPKLGLERVKKMGGTIDRIESETIAFHEAIRETFHAIAKKEPKRFHLLDASLSPDQVFKQGAALIDVLLAAAK